MGLPFELLKILETLYSETLPVNPGNVDKAVQKEAQRTLQAQKLLVRYLGANERYSLLIKTLSQQVDFVFFIESLLQIQVKLHMFLLSQWNITIDNRKVLLILIRFSKDYIHLSKAEILTKLISWIFTQLETQEQLTGLTKHLLEIPDAEIVWREAASTQPGFSDNQLNREDVPQSNPEEQLLKDDEQPISFISNAGLILLAPFLPRLFSLLQLTENGKFKDRDAQIKAMFLIQYAVFGSTEFPEYELQLNKLLTGFKTGIPVPRSVTLTEEDINTTEGMLHGVVQHWNKVRTIDGLREGFLQRKGKLDENDEIIELTVENKAFDMLMDSVPWNFKTTKFSWMDKTIQVKWR